MTATLARAGRFGYHRGVTTLLALALRVLPASGPAELAIHPGPADTFTVTFTREAPGSGAGPFGGTVALNGSAAELPVSGQADRADGRLRVALTVRYADVPADWVTRFRPESFEYRVRGRVAGRDEVQWSGSMRWNAVAVEGEKETASRFVRLDSLALTRFSLLESEARATVRLRNPFSFPLKLAGANYVLLANGHEVGSGETGGILLHAGQNNALQFPIEIDHAQLLGAAGGALASGGEVRGHLRGQLTLRLPGGDIAVPLDLSGRLSILSE